MNTKFLFSYILFHTVMTTGSIFLHWLLFKHFISTKNKWFWPVCISFSLMGPSSLLLFRFKPNVGIITSIFQTEMGLVFFLSIMIFMITTIKKVIYKKISKSPFFEHRRMFLKGSTAIWGTALISPTIINGVREALKPPDIVRIKIPIKNWPTELSGFKIAQITDLHVGPTIQREFVQKVVVKTLEEKPDIITLTGDMVDGSVEQLLNSVEPLKQLFAPKGVYFITGNHEYYSGAIQWINHFKSYGFEFLGNDCKNIKMNNSEFDLLGINDHHARRFIESHEPDLSKALSTSKKENPKILLSHQPKDFDKAESLGVNYQISGHTHGGQIWPFRYFVRLTSPYVKGLYKINESYIYVSCGSGFWGPALRIGAPSEITIHEFYSSKELQKPEIERVRT